MEDRSPEGFPSLYLLVVELFENRIYMKKDILQWKVTTSRGQNTYGYNIVSLYINGVKEFSTNGGGYDMHGTVLAQYVKAKFADRLKNLASNRGSLDDGTGYYGLTFTHVDKEKKVQYLKKYEDGAKIWLDGACGWNAIASIMHAIGLQMNKVEVYKLMTYEVIDNGVPVCAHYQCNNAPKEKSDSCEGHQYCECKNVTGKHYKMNCTK